MVTVVGTGAGVAAGVGVGEGVAEGVEASFLVAPVASRVEEDEAAAALTLSSSCSPQGAAQKTRGQKAAPMLRIAAGLELQLGWSSCCA